MQYHVVFDIAQAGYRYWWIPTSGLLFVLIGIILVRFPNTIKDRMPGGENALPFLFLGIAIF